jgi:hypothetical protein
VHFFATNAANAPVTVRPTDQFSDPATMSDLSPYYPPSLPISAKFPYAPDAGRAGTERTRNIDRELRRRIERNIPLVRKTGYAAG